MTLKAWRPSCSSSICLTVKQPSSLRAPVLQSCCPVNPLRFTLETSSQAAVAGCSGAAGWQWSQLASKVCLEARYLHPIRSTRSRTQVSPVAAGGFRFQTPARISGNIWQCTGTRWSSLGPVWTQSGPRDPQKGHSESQLVSELQHCMKHTWTSRSPWRF